MMERRRPRNQPSGLLQQRGSTPNDVVAVCKAYSQRLKEKPVRVKLHVSAGRVADGTISLDTDPREGGPAQLVVQAHGSNLFGLVKREFQHVFEVGELERSRSTHTAFLLRSIKQLAKGNEAMKEEILARSLSLVHRNEAVDMTFATREECDKLGEWIDAKWSVSMIQKSFRGNSRIALALQGKGKQRGGGDGGREALEDDEEEGEGDAVDGAGFGRLPTLDPATKSKLQDDLLDGVHVAYHDLSLRGYRSVSSPRRLRYDCQSKDGLVFLEPSFEGDGETIIQPISGLIQVGGGPSAFGLTASLLRATADKKQQRAKAVSLVFAERAVDITCGSEKDATELVLYFSEVRGFTRAKPPSQDLDLTAPPRKPAAAAAAAAAAAGAGAGAGAGGGAGATAGVGDRQTRPDREVKEVRRDLGVARVGVGGGGHRGEPPFPRYLGGRAGGAPPAVAEGVRKAEAGEGAVHKTKPKRERVADPTFSHRFRSGYGGGDLDAVTALERQVSAASGFSVTSSLLGAGRHDHLHWDMPAAAAAAEAEAPLPGKDEAILLEKQASAASGFGASPSLRIITSAASPSGGGGGGGGGGGSSSSGGAPASITQHRMWTTHQGTAPTISSLTATSVGSHPAGRFRSSPGPAWRPTVGGGPDPVRRVVGRVGGSAQDEGGREQVTGQRQNHGRHPRDSDAAQAPPPPRAAEEEQLPSYQAVCGSAVAGNKPAVRAEGAGRPHEHQQHRHHPRTGRTVGQPSDERETHQPASGVLRKPRSPTGGPRQPLPSPTGKAEGGAARRGSDDASSGGGGASPGAALPSAARGRAGAPGPAPPLPPREIGGTGGGGGGVGADHQAAERQHYRANLVAQFPGGNRGPSAGAGDGADAGAGAGAGAGVGADVPAPAAAGAAAARPRARGRPVHPARLGVSPTRRPAPFTSPAELVASTCGIEHEERVIHSATNPVGRGREAGDGSGGGNVSETTIERRRFGGVERRTIQVRGGRGGSGGGHGSGSTSGTGGLVNRNSVVGHDDDDDDDDNYTTVRVKGVGLVVKPPPSPTSSASPTTDADHVDCGRRRSCTPTMERTGLAAEIDRQRHASNPSSDRETRRRSSTPTKIERTGGQRQISPTKDRFNRGRLGKAIRGGAHKLFATAGAGTASTSSGTPLSSSGSSGGRRGLGLGSLDGSNNGTRTRLGGRFFSNQKGGSGGVGGVEDFSGAGVGAGPGGDGGNLAGFKSSPGN